MTRLWVCTKITMWQLKFKVCAPLGALAAQTECVIGPTWLLLASIGTTALPNTQADNKHVAMEQQRQNGLAPSGTPVARLRTAPMNSMKKLFWIVPSNHYIFTQYSSWYSSQLNLQTWFQRYALPWKEAKIHEIWHDSMKNCELRCTKKCPGKEVISYMNSLAWEIMN